MQEIEIRVKGHMDPDWSGWLGDLSPKHLATGETLLTGNVRDQSALYGLLERLASLGLELRSVVCKTPATGKGQGASTGQVTIDR
jgi:hypothetical protein